MNVLEKIHDFFVPPASDSTVQPISEIERQQAVIKAHNEAKSSKNFENLL